MKNTKENNKTLVKFLINSGLRLIFPRFKLPEPSGEYGIGSFPLQMVDNNRNETYSNSPDELRKIMIQFWYPIQKDLQASFTPYPKEVGTALRSVMNLPEWLFQHFENIETHTVANAPIAYSQEKVPLILFSPGNKSTRFQNMALIEELVSNGYIVIGVDHPYTSSDVSFTDGTIAKRELNEKSSLDDVKLFEHEINIRTEDIIFLLNKIENNSFSYLINSVVEHINFDKIGFMGHSYGGATVAEAMARDSRIKAGISFDGGLWGTAPKKGFSQPFLYISAEKTLKIAKSKSTKKKALKNFVLTVMNNLSSLYEKGDEKFYYLKIQSYNHYSFTDLPLISVLFNSGKKPIGTTNIYTKTFFDYYLKEIEDVSLAVLSFQKKYVHFLQGDSNFSSVL